MIENFIKLKFCMSFLPVWNMYTEYVEVQHNRPLSIMSQLITLGIVYKNSYGCPVLGASILRNVIKNKCTISEVKPVEEVAGCALSKILSLQSICNN